MISRKTSPKTVAVIGAGGRGVLYGALIAENFLEKVAAVAEPRSDYREGFAKRFGIPRERQFKSWQEFVAQPKMCDAVVVATMDRDHVGPAVACLQKGYDMLLEKPMAITLEDCRAIEAAQRQSKAIVAVCHSLRYNKGFRKVFDLAADGAIGKIITIDQLEDVAFWHQAHSFVRGNWGNEGRSAFMLLAKSCHDIDYIAFLAGQPCRRVSSFGSLTYFCRQNAPKGSPERCTDGCPAESSCPYSAIKTYVHTADRHLWPANVVSYDHSAAAHLEAIRTGPYGRCIFKCDNDVVDHQVVAMEFEDDITATFTMTAFGFGGRRVRVHGTEGMLLFQGDKITLHTFRDRNTTTIEVAPESGGHGGGDTRVVREWLQALHAGNDSCIVTNAQESLRTHTIVFAAEKSRREKRTVDMAAM